MPYILFVVGLLALIFGGNWFVDGATSIARRLRIPEVIIGATIVSIGTTLPEVMVSADSAIKGHGEIAYGNAVGSIICNTALILAVTLMVRIVYVQRREIILPTICFFTAAVIYIISAYVFRSFYRVTGILLLIIFAVYIFISVRNSLKISREQVMDTVQETEVPASYGSRFSIVKDILMLVVGAALIAIGANLLVDNGTIIAERMGVPESVIALTFVALGTSLPELVTAVVSLVKKHSDLSLGNIVGANLFNLVLVSGLSITINPFDIPGGKMIAGMNASLLIDMPLMVIVMLLVLIPVLIRQRTFKVQGFILIVLYIGFILTQFVF